MPSLNDRFAASLYGIAIGDGMGAPVEGWNPEDIARRFSSVETFLPPTHGDEPSLGKGHGRITDDTLMTEALIHAYVKALDHLDAYGYVRFVLPEIITHKKYIPEQGREAPIIERLWWPEKYPWMRLTMAHADPRQAGVGNCVNCGIAMWMMPVGAVNVADPFAAYQEAAAIGLAHNESFAVEAGAAMAAAFSAAFSPEATIDAVIAATLDLSQDGTRKACRAAVQAANPGDSLPAFIASTRAAVAAFDGRASHTADDAGDAKKTDASDVGKPSRMGSIEELPVALAALKYGHGDFLKTLKAAVFYGRDCDSIAGMACGLHGALYGLAAIPENLRSASDAANKRDFSRIGAELYQAAQRIHQKDSDRFAARRNAYAG